MAIRIRKSVYALPQGDTTITWYRKAVDVLLKKPVTDPASWRYLAAVHRPTLTGATPAERTMVERWMDWLLGALNTPYVAVFKDVKKAPAERAPDFAAQAADLVAQLKILDGHIAGRDWFALDRFTIADIALGSIVKRCLEFPIERPAYPEVTRWQAAIDARPAFAAAVGAKPSALSPAA